VRWDTPVGERGSGELVIARDLVIGKAKALTTKDTKEHGGKSERQKLTADERG
jgi:hypothetical protein